MKNDRLLLDNQLCFRLYSVSRKMTKAYQPLLEKFNLTYPQYVTMLVVFEYEEIDFKALSDKLNLKTGTITPILQKLEQAGYINRVPNKQDHRKLNIVLTPIGKKLNEDIIEVPNNLTKRLQVSLEMYNTLVEELDELDGMLDEMMKADN
ncbi:MAG: MarR family winged helix-turn-helix transcriptional regulator [Bacillota bacterium]